MKITLRKKVLFLLVITIINCDSYGQNLVPNPSFENYESCPRNVSNFYKLQDWILPSYHNGSTDYFNSCASDTGFSNVGVPLNLLGYQSPAHGNAYIGLHTLADTNYREYAQVKLLSPLKANEKYNVSFKCNLANTSFWATDGIGICFTVQPVVGNNDYHVIALSPQVSVTSIISDTTNWTTISQDFIAQGGEEYITIGNFKSNNNTLQMSTGVSPIPNIPPSYLYIDDVSVENACGLNANLGNDTILCLGETIRLSATNPRASRYEWSNGSSDSIIYVTQEGIYKVTLFDSSCQSTESIQIDFIPCSCELFIPNAFTPNGDGLNDVFKPLGTCTYSNYDLRIYNRWGQVVFRSNNPENGWQGDSAPIGTYYYLLKYNESFSKKGDIVLIR